MKHLTSTLIAAAIGLFATIRADAAPLDIGQCMTISQSGSYRLAGNLQSGLGDCIVVLTDNVSIDLAGFTIRGRSSNGPLGNQRNVVPLDVSSSTLDWFVEKNVTGSR